MVLDFNFLFVATFLCCEFFGSSCGCFNLVLVSLVELLSIFEEISFVFSFFCNLCKDCFFIILFNGYQSFCFGYCSFDLVLMSFVEISGFFQKLAFITSLNSVLIVIVFVVICVIIIVLIFVVLIVIIFILIFIIIILIL